MSRLLSPGGWALLIAAIFLIAWLLNELVGPPSGSPPYCDWTGSGWDCSTT